MSKKVYENMLSVPNKEYEIPFFYKEDILNKRVSPTDRMWLNHEGSLIYSLVYEMFKFIGDTRSYKEIFDECFNEEKWYTNHEWTISQNEDFKRTIGVPLIMKVLKTSKSRAETEYAWFCLSYGFKYSDPENAFAK